MPPLTREFLHHLDELMRETTESLRKELADHTNELVAAARKTNNSAGIPVAYSQASIDNFRTRVRSTIDKYLDALENCGIAVDAVVEREMLQKIHRLTHTHGSLTLPPMIRGPNVTAVKQSHAMAMTREGTALQREAANRLRELKMKASPNVSATNTMTQPPPPFTIASVAPTLAVLKALPMQEQAMLLLRRMVVLRPQMGSSGFSKHNLSMPGDQYGLARGFGDHERTPAVTHLLGAPWKRLEMEGYIVDPPASGWFTITEEGFAAAEEAAKPKEVLTAHSSPRPELPVKLEHPDRPVAFMSYSWETKEHEDWVLGLANRLVSEGGVNVILDKWHLHFGMDKTVFMEDGIENSNFVLVICTPEYAKKANKRRGGVGYEAMIITGELAEDIQTIKFIPVLRIGAWDRTSMPRWLKTKTGPDLRGNPYNEEQFKLLVRELHGHYLKPPAPGPKPDFSSLAHAPEPATARAPVVQLAPAPPQAPHQQNAIAYAFYETKGPDAQYFKMYIRPVDSANDVFSLETSDGELTQGTFYVVAREFVRLDRKYVSRGYILTHKFNGTGRRDVDIP